MIDKSTLKSIARLFTEAGGKFIAPPEKIVNHLNDIRVIIFDWDGVMGSGRKGEGVSSTFHEADSMGINMLRYGFWRKNNKLPYAAIITGESNQTAVQFAQRENFHSVYRGVKNKKTALKHLLELYKLSGSQALFVFDDINDLGIAEMCGLRMLVNRSCRCPF